MHVVAFKLSPMSLITFELSYVFFRRKDQDHSWSIRSARPPISAIAPEHLQVTASSPPPRNN